LQQKKRYIGNGRTCAAARRLDCRLNRRSTGNAGAGRDFNPVIKHRDQCHAEPATVESGSAPMENAEPTRPRQF
jgi:hypothetical protein